MIFYVFPLSNSKPSVSAVSKLDSVFKFKHDKRDESLLKTSPSEPHFTKHGICNLNGIDS